MPVIDYAPVRSTGITRTIERRSGIFRRKVKVVQEEVVVQPWDTNSGRDTGPEESRWVDLN